MKWLVDINLVVGMVLISSQRICNFLMLIMIRNEGHELKHLVIEIFGIFTPES